MNRGDVYQAVLNPSQGSEQSGTRPVVIVSREAINRNSQVVIVVPLTSRANKIRILPCHVEIKINEGGVTMESVVLCEQVRAIAVSRLRKGLGHLPEQRIAEINAALKIALDLP
jgi:mRNA interferase MazF